jgi:hypothetical protein
MPEKTKASGESLFHAIPTPISDLIGRANILVILNLGGAR